MRMRNQKEKKAAKARTKDINRHQMKVADKMKILSDRTHLYYSSMFKLNNNQVIKVKKSKLVAHLIIIMISQRPRK